jgi:predicted 2-oxoglutarate/Fe(II)-dependent dioxygenase YbiX
MNLDTSFSSAALATLLRTIRRHGDFFATGRAEMAPPNLSVQGLGMLSLPFQHSQLMPLLAQAALAPFGRGAQTVVDTAVRHTWQIDAGALTFGGRNWQQSLNAIATCAADGLGVLEPVKAQLYKLLIYDTGSFFVEHRDTEKAAGMFATQVLVLPSIYSGGELSIRHGEREVRIDLAGADPAEAAFVAFYADCVHEVLPVTSGARLALVYNLVRDGGKGALSAPEHGPEVRAVAELLCRWAAAPDAGATPGKLVYPLEHAYSSAELGFATLKHVDAAVAQVLVAAAALANCDVHLALLDIEESGSAEYAGYRPRRYRGYDEDDEAGADQFEIGEIFDGSATLSGWRTSDGGALTLGALPLMDEELCPPGVFDDAEPDELHFHEATGNEGVSFDRAYRRAALVLWPRARRMAVIGEGGPAAALPYLEHMVAEWLRTGAPGGGQEWQDACALADALVQEWPIGYGGSGALAARMLTSLIELRHAALIDIYLEQVAGTGRFGGDEAASLAAAARLLPLSRAAELIEAIVAANASFVPGPCAVLLSHFCRGCDDAQALLAPAAHRLADTLLGRHVSPQPASGQRWPVNIDAAAVLAVLVALRDVGDAALGGAVVEHSLAACALDAVLVVAALEVAADAALMRFAPADRLRASVLMRIEQRIAMELAPPRDWRRPSALSCACRYCAQLAQFLDDPAFDSWTLKAAETHRRHVQDIVRSNHCDVDCVTVRQGSPHGLACTKNQASYDARCRQREADLMHAGRLAMPSKGK